LVRFAAEPYEELEGKSFDDKKWSKLKFSHLTNYSINKKHKKFEQNFSVEQDDCGSKWSISALCRHLKSTGIDNELLWQRIYDIFLKVLISGEYGITKALKEKNIN
jgi:hypothetical protein